VFSRLTLGKCSRYLWLPTICWKLLLFLLDTEEWTGYSRVINNTAVRVRPRACIWLVPPAACRNKGQLKCDGTRAETRFRLSGKRTNPFKSAGTSVHPTTGSQVMCISGSNAGYTVFRGSVKGTGYPLNSPVSPSLPLSCVTVCHHISTGVYDNTQRL